MCVFFLQPTVTYQSDGERNEFREDLYYRLNVVNLRIPTLSERAEDIPVLANHLLRESKRHKPLCVASQRMR